MISFLRWWWGVCEWWFTGAHVPTMANLGVLASVAAWTWASWDYRKVIYSGNMNRRDLRQISIMVGACGVVSAAWPVLILIPPVVGAWALPVIVACYRAHYEDITNRITDRLEGS